MLAQEKNCSNKIKFDEVVTQLLTPRKKQNYDFLKNGITVKIEKPRNVRLSIKVVVFKQKF